MYINDAAEQCLEWVGTIPWTWFVTLRHCHDLALESRRRQYLDPRDAFLAWADDIEREYGLSHGLRYVMATERRAHRDVNFHILLQDVPEEDRLSWKSRWKEYAPGYGKDREIRPTMQGLFRFFVYKRQCSIEGSLGYSFVEFDPAMEREWK